MKRIRVKQNQIALVFKNDQYQRFLKEGVHWIKWGETVKRFSGNQAYELDETLLDIKNDLELMKVVDIIQIQSNQVGLFYRNGFLQDYTGRGIYLLVHGKTRTEVLIQDLNSTKDISEIVNDNLYVNLRGLTNSYHVESFQKGLLIQNGKFVRELEAGNYTFWEGSQKLEVLKTDIRLNQLELSGQELLTKDKASLRINFNLEYQVKDVRVALMENQDFQRQLYTYGQLALREFVGSLNLDELLENKSKVGEYVLQNLKTKSSILGVVVHTAGIKDIILTGDVKNIMNQVLIAEKKAQANVIMRREETAMTRSLLNTAKMMEDNATLMKLKEMEFIEKVAEKVGQIQLNSGGKLLDQMTQMLIK